MIQYMFDRAATSCSKTYFWTNPKISVSIYLRWSAAKQCCKTDLLGSSKNQCFDLCSNRHPDKCHNADFWTSPAIRVSIYIQLSAHKKCRSTDLWTSPKMVFQFMFDLAATSCCKRYFWTNPKTVFHLIFEHTGPQNGVRRIFGMV